MSGTRLWQAKMLSRKYLQSLKLVLISVAFILLLLEQINRSWLECFLWLHRVNGTTVIYPLVNVAPCVSWGWDGHMAPQVLLLFFSNVQLALHFGRFNPIFLIYAFFKKKNTSDFISGLTWVLQGFGRDNGASSSSSSVIMEFAFWLF